MVNLLIAACILAFTFTNATPVTSNSPAVKCLLSFNPKITLVSANDQPAWDYIRLGSWLQVDLTPAIIIQVQDPADVQTAVMCAKRLGIPVIPRCGGQSFMGLSSTNGILVNLKPYSPVLALDADKGIITVGAGATLGRVFLELKRYSFVKPP
jgi:FAD/FMN-containing dehydrogenase